MNEKRFERVLERLAEFPAPSLLMDNSYRTGARSNDPDRDYLQRDQELRTEGLERVLDATLTQLNVQVGFAETAGETIGGIGALVVQAAPDAARALVGNDGRETLNSIAATLLEPKGLPAWGKYQILNGPNWGGDNNAWLTPSEIALGLRRVLEVAEAAAQGRRCEPRRVDYEQERADTAWVFRFSEPLAGCRHATAREAKTRQWLHGRPRPFVLRRTS